MQQSLSAAPCCPGWRRVGGVEASPGRTAFLSNLLYCPHLLTDVLWKCRNREIQLPVQRLSALDCHRFTRESNRRQVPKNEFTLNSKLQPRE